ncbi:MAG TPA: hypothetical protein VIC57_15455 [Candidatus Dormibacteraeota bacterium]
MQSNAGARGRTLDLTPHFDNDGISAAGNTADGAFNVWRNTFPAEDLPASGELVDVAGIAFRFPSKADGALNNVVCGGQLIEVPPGAYDWIYVLAAGERRSEDPVYLHFASGAVDPEWLRVSDFWPGPPRFGEVVAFRARSMHYPRHAQRNLEPTIWLQRVPVTRLDRLVAIRLPENRAMHLFAATLVPAVRAVAPAPEPAREEAAVR